MPSQWRHQNWQVNCLGSEPALTESGQELRQIVAEASSSLALLDAVRLEEIGCNCRALVLGLPALEPGTRDNLAQQAREALQEMDVFARVIEATRANLDVMRRLRDLREGCLENDGCLEYGRPRR